MSAKNHQPEHHNSPSNHHNFTTKNPAKFSTNLANPLKNTSKRTVFSLHNHTKKIESDTKSVSHSSGGLPLWEKFQKALIDRMLSTLSGPLLLNVY